MNNNRTPGVIFQPKTAKAMQRGFNWMLSAIRPTLGPLPGMVAVEGSMRSQAPELLDNAGTLVRRILEHPNPDADMGAMLLRAVLWRLQERVGDGTATAAVLFGSVYNEALRYVAAGGNSMMLRRYLERGMRLVLDHLNEISTPIEGQARLAQLAEAICFDPPLARMLGEIFDIIGEFGQFDLREGRGRDLEREYVEGIYWDGGLLAREMITDNIRHRTDLENPAVVVSDLDIEDPRSIVPLLDQAIKAGLPSLLIIARSISPAVISVLVADKNRARMPVMAVKAPFMVSSEQAAVLEDIRILTGGRPLIRDAGDRIEDVKLSDLGKTRRAWADRNFFGIIGGGGDPRALREHIAALRQNYADTRDPERRENLRRRIGKLIGGSAILWIGAATESEQKVRKTLAERTANTLRGAILEGVAPGGGVAFLACRPVLEAAMRDAAGPDERAAYGILLAALEEPIRTIVQNAGYKPDKVLADLGYAGPGCGFDVINGRITDMAEAGIMDVTAVLKEAWYTAITSAALALTVDVLVHHRTPSQSVDPE